MGKLKASVLANVLVVSTLLLLGMLALVSFFDLSENGFYAWHQQEQQRAYMESAFTLYSQDSSLYERGRGKDSCRYRLFEEDPASEVTFRRQMWGLYEVVTVENYNQSRKSVRLMGKGAPAFAGAVLYLPDNGRSLALAGNTRISGKISYPGNGITYTQIRSAFFSGTPVEPGQLKKSTAYFPPVLPESREELERLMRLPVTGEVRNLCRLEVPFDEEIAVLSCGEWISGTEFGGHIVLHNDKEIYIDSTCHLDQVVVTAPVIIVGDGFRGSAQLLATDTILVGDRVKLVQPSGLYLSGSNPDRIVSIGKKSRLEGYLITEGPDKDQRRAQCRIPSSAVCFGLVYVDGIAEVQGRVAGSLYMRESCWFAPEGYYSMVLYDAIVEENTGVVYPFWMEGPYERRCAGWAE